MIGTEILRLIGQGLTASGRAITPADPVDAHAAEVTAQLSLRPQYHREELARGAVEFAAAGRELTTAELRERAALGVDVQTAARSTIAEALGLPGNATTGAIVVAIRGLRETAENPPVVEVDTDQVSLPVAAAIDAREQIEQLRQGREILRRDNERLRALVGPGPWVKVCPRCDGDVEALPGGLVCLECTAEMRGAEGATHAVRLAWHAAGLTVRNIVKGHSPELHQALQDLEKAARGEETATTSAPAAGPDGSGQGETTIARAGLRFSELFDNLNPQQDEARSTPTTDGGEPS